MSSLEIEHDGSGKAFIEVLLQPGERLRVTLVEDSWVGGKGIRLQLRSDDGHLRQGPEIPASAIGEVVEAVVELISKA